MKVFWWVPRWARLGGWVGATAALLAASGTSSAQGFVRGRVLVKFKESAGEARANGLLALSGLTSEGEIPRTGVKAVRIPANANEKAVANYLKSLPDVEFAELDQEIRLAYVPNDPNLGLAWHHTKINSFAAWDTTLGSSSIIVGVVDSGVDGTHPDLLTRMVPGWNFYDNNNNTADVIGHGTPVAGCIAATANNALGTAGVAGGCLIMPLRVTNTSGSASFSAIASAITWAADRGARIVSASLAMVNSGTIDSAANYLMSKRGLYFMASGNTSSYSGGANSAPIVTVGATDQNDNRASFSTYGPWVDISAPGVNVYTTNRGGGYGGFGGTSAATPVAAGVAALALSANPSLSASQLMQVMTNSGVDLGTAGWDQNFGWGRVNAAGAVNLALSMSGPDTKPPTLDFQQPAEGETVTGTRNLFAVATDDVQLDSVKFYINDVLKATFFSGPFSWSWNTTTYANGAYTLKAVASDMAGNSVQQVKNVTVSNVADTTPPTVSITSPTSGASAGNKLNVSILATDNRGVTRVEIWVDGKLAGTDTASPWSFSLNSRKWTAGTHTLVAKAYDAAGNLGTSASVSVIK